MPKPALHTLRWSVHNKIYTLLTPDQQPLELVTGHEEQWFVWLATHSSFSFQGQSGHLNVLKEKRKRGAGYWYAYHSEEGKRNKRYLGPRDRLTLAFLEQVAKEFSCSLASSAFTQPHSAQQNQPRVALLASKLSPPHLPLILVQRSRLLDELEAIVNHPLTLVSANLSKKNASYHDDRPGGVFLHPYGRAFERKTALGAF
ncbi:hypothetical protein KSF_090660 [Reticulibacter mediterranei]|uniref:Uncharacterized protein n=1 Tax=Reticulibacter mediterranei TaxID=2778369 RepID=A0A8J3IRL3_9CHLR|nr:hypothetical protein [Reticulibacter mediterranei]GHO99018.1 hypothetical protein KSF_090660 [Reticulibacter mediterranei]